MRNLQDTIERAKKRLSDKKLEVKALESYINRLEKRLIKQLDNYESKEN